MIKLQGPSPADLDRISEVLPYLYVGSYGAAEKSGYLAAEGITHGICVVEKLPKSLSTFPHLWIPASDHGESDLRELLAQAIPFIQAAHEANGRVLVFCALGINRSPALVAGYLREALGYSLSEALQRIFRSRSFISIHGRYLAQLEQLGVG